jgi:hypothetical protein
MTHKAKAGRFAAHDALTKDELDTVSGGTYDTGYCEEFAALARCLAQWHYMVGQTEPN